MSRDVGAGKGTIIKMLDLLTKANVIHPVYPYSAGGKIRKELKYLFTSPTIREILLSFLGEEERVVGLIREDLFAMHIDDLFYLKTGPDYIWRNTLFEIGGERKTTEQFKQFKQFKITKKMRKYVIHEGLQITSNEINEIIRLPFYIFLSYF